MRFGSFPATLGLLSFLLIIAACGDNYVVGEGGNCNPEGWVGGHGVCAAGYVCSDFDGWTCVPDHSASTTGHYPVPSPASDAASDAAPHDADASTDPDAAPIAESDREKDAGISGLDGG